MNIAFIGLGNMGSGMCRNLVKAGHKVMAFDLNPESVRQAVSDGAEQARSIAEAVSNAMVVVTMLPAGKHVHSVLFDEGGVIASAGTNTLLIDCSTISVEDARSASRKASEAGFAIVDAPVSGGVAAAAAGSLTFMVGGDEAAVTRARPVLDIMGTNVVHAGGAGNGQVAKIANNMLLGISMIATCEAFNLAKQLGLDAQSFFDISSKASGQNWSMTSYCPVPGPLPNAPSNHGYLPGFAVDMMLKDLRLAADAAAACNTTTELGQKALETYQALSADGHGGMDFSVVAKQLAGDL